MTETVHGDAGERVVTFEGPATIPHVADAWTRLCAAVAEGDDLRIELSETTSADLSFIQLFEAARTACEQHGANLRLARPAEGALHDVLLRGGFLDGSDPARLQFWTHAGAVK